MQILVYTCVFRNYDWVMPPVQPDPSLDYVLITDSDGPAPRHWRRIVVDPSEWGGARVANRYWKILGYQRLVEGHDAVLYVDANIRVLRDTRAFVEEHISSDGALALFRHPHRTCIRSEADDVLGNGKVKEEDQQERELEHYKQNGFRDDVGLSENTILLRRDCPETWEAMQLWWEMFNIYGSRDQISLPYVRWKTGVEVNWIEWSFRDKNPYFSIYSHRKRPDVNPLFAWIEGRSLESWYFSLIYRLWMLGRAASRRVRILFRSAALVISRVSKRPGK